MVLAGLFAEGETVISGLDFIRRGYEHLPEKFASLGGSVRFWEKSSVDLVVHDYRQRKASETLADSRLTADPAGLKTSLGQEVDLFVAFRESPSTEVTVSVGTFRSGSAFGERSGERAWYGAVGVTVNF